MKIMRYLLVIVLGLLGILVFINIPNLAKAMLETVSAVTWQEWLRYIIGIIIGSVATYFAMQPKKVIVGEDNSNDN